MKAIEFNTKEEAEQVAIDLHELLKNEEGYTSEAYGMPIETINGTFLVFKINGFDKQLKKYEFKEVDFKLIKREEI